MAVEQLDAASAAKGLEDELDAIRAETFAQLRVKLAKPLPPFLYHYGRASTLQKVLESGCIWATEGRFLNDTTELRHASHVAIDYLRKRWGTEPDWLLPALLRAVRGDAEQRTRLMFVASFSRDGDSLSQWRAYADDGAGFSLGFDPSALHASTTPVGEQLTEPVLDRCIYSKRAQRGALEDCIPQQIAAGIRFVANGGDTKTARLEVTRSVLVSVGLLGCILKQSGFREEREWRILVMAHKGLQSALEFRDTKFGPAPYVKVPLGTPLPLARVVLGPRTNPAVERTVRLMLDRHGSTASITRSRVSYR
jgi:hypothetical protein